MHSSPPPQALTELALRSHQVLMLPMLALTRAWQAALAGQPPAAPLVTLLGQLNDKLGQQWVAWGNTQLAAVEAYEGRSKMGLQQGEVVFVWGGGGGDGGVCLWKVGEGAGGWVWMVG